MSENQSTAWNGIPPNGQGMYHWLVNKDHGRHVVAWFDLHEWTAFGKAQTQQEIAAMYDYLAPCDPPNARHRAALEDILSAACREAITGEDAKLRLIMIATYARTALWGGTR